MNALDPLSVIEGFDARWNAHNEQGILEYFTDDVVIKLSPPPPPPLREMSNGKEQARDFIRWLLPGFYVNSTDHRVSSDTVTWKFTLFAEGFRQMGVVPVTGTAEAVLEQGKISHLNPSFDEDTVRKFQAIQGARE